MKWLKRIAFQKSGHSNEWQVWNWSGTQNCNQINRRWTSRPWQTLQTYIFGTSALTKLMTVIFNNIESKITTAFWTHIKWRWDGDEEKLVVKEAIYIGSIFIYVVMWMKRKKMKFVIGLRIDTLYAITGIHWFRLPSKIFKQGHLIKSIWQGYTANTSTRIVRCMETFMAGSLFGTWK